MINDQFTTPWQTTTTISRLEWAFSDPSHSLLITTTVLILIAAVMGVKVEMHLTTACGGDAGSLHHKVQAAWLGVKYRDDFIASCSKEC